MRFLLIFLLASPAAAGKGAVKRADKLYVQLHESLEAAPYCAAVADSLQLFTAEEGPALRALLDEIVANGQRPLLVERSGATLDAIDAKIASCSDNPQLQRALEQYRHVVDGKPVVPRWEAWGSNCQAWFDMVDTRCDLPEGDQRAESCMLIADAPNKAREVAAASEDPGRHYVEMEPACLAALEQTDLMLTRIGL